MPNRLQEKGGAREGGCEDNDIIIYQTRLLQIVKVRLNQL